MGKFILTYELNGKNFENIKRIEHEFNEEHLDNVLMSFEHFLRGCGYYFDGHLDLVEDEQNHIDDSENRDEWLEDQYYEYRDQYSDDELGEYKVSDEWKWTVNEIAKHAK